jgi:hypothetical protein
MLAWATKLVQHVHVEADLEFEQCVNAEGTLVLATWAIEEDHVELADLTGPAAED